MVPFPQQVQNEMGCNAEHIESEGQAKPMADIVGADIAVANIAEAGIVEASIAEAADIVGFVAAR